MFRSKDYKNSYRMTTNGVDHLKQRTVLFNPEKEESQNEEQFKEIKMNQKMLKEKVSKYQRK
jgi:predicted SprT family Zn-dependent metalloprotease